MNKYQILVQIPNLNYMDVVVDFERVDEDGEYSVTYEESEEFTDDQIKKEIFEYVNSAITEVLAEREQEEQND